MAELLKQNQSPDKLDLNHSNVKVLKALLTKVYLDPTSKIPIRTPMLQDEHISSIARLALDNPLAIQLGSYIHHLGLSDEDKQGIVDTQLNSIPDERFAYFDRLAEAIQLTHTIPIKISLANINPFTPFEQKPPVLFGMGGGSQRLCQGLPIDVLKMVFTAEKLRRELDLGTIHILCANDITYTNIGKHKEFSKESIDAVMSSERDLLQLIVERLGLADHFRIFLSTDLDQVVGQELKESYDAMVEDAKQVPFVHDLHYAMEIAEMWSIINQQLGGIKLGWFMYNTDPDHPKYIMDEQPFDARYALYLASRGIMNNVSIPYIRAGARLYPDKKGFAQKVPPYIDYDPANRILLSPFEDAMTKMVEATKMGGGAKLKSVRGNFNTIVELFEELILGKADLITPRVVGKKLILEKRLRQVGIEDLTGVKKEKIARLKKSLAGEDVDETHEEGTGIGNKIQFILDYIFEKDRESAERIWKKAFPV